MMEKPAASSAPLTKTLRSVRFAAYIKETRWYLDGDKLL